MSVTITLPEVSACEATACAYNTEHRCHAPAITIGDALIPACDTFLPARHHVEPEPVAGVGACKVTACTHNHERTCHAGSIDIKVEDHGPDCATFETDS